MAATQPEPPTPKRVKRRRPPGEPDADANKRRMPVHAEVDVALSSVFEKWIRHERIVEDRSLVDMAKGAGITEPMLYRMRYNKNTWTVFAFLGLCRSLGLHPQNVLVEAGLIKREPKRLAHRLIPTVEKARELDDPAKAQVLAVVRDQIEQTKLRARQSQYGIRSGDVRAQRPKKNEG